MRIHFHQELKHLLRKPFPDPLAKALLLLGSLMGPSSYERQSRTRLWARSRCPPVTWSPHLSTAQKGSRVEGKESSAAGQPPPFHACVNQILSRRSQLAAFSSRLLRAEERSFDLYSHWTGPRSAGNSLLLCCQHSAHPLPSKLAASPDLPRGFRSPRLASAARSLGLQQQVTSLP